MISIKNLSKYSCLVGLAVLFAACGDNAGPKPKGNFTTQVDEENTLTVHFTNTSENASEYTWEFGENGATSQEANPSYTYAEGGAYKVTLTAKGSGGSDEYINFAVPVTPPPPIVNLFQDGDFENGGDAWSVNHFGSEIGVSYDGSMKLTASGNVNSFIYQVVEVEAGKKYQFTADIAASGLNSTWVELYFLEGDQAPTGDPGTSGMFLGWSTWCGGTSDINGKFEDIECNGSGSAHNGNGKVTFENSGKMVFGMKVGICCNGTWGDGITIDNLLLTAIE